MSKLLVINDVRRAFLREDRISVCSSCCRYLAVLLPLSLLLVLCSDF